MDIQQKIIEKHTNKKIYVLKDELGNKATGQTYHEALKYLLLRRGSKKERGNENELV